MGHKKEINQLIYIPVKYPYKEKSDQFLIFLYRVPDSLRKYFIRSLHQKLVFSIFTYEFISTNSVHSSEYISVDVFLELNMY